MSTPMRYESVNPHDVNPGDRVCRDSGPVGTVVEIRDPSHGLAAAHGGVVLELERERLLQADRDRFGPIIRWTVTAIPGLTTLYRELTPEQLRTRAAEMADAHRRPV